jgi:hypothetical protein
MHQGAAPADGLVRFTHPTKGEKDRVHLLGLTRGESGIGACEWVLVPIHIKGQFRNSGSE